MRSKYKGDKLRDVRLLGCPIFGLPRDGYRAPGRLISRSQTSSASTKSLLSLPSSSHHQKKDPRLLSPSNHHQYHSHYCNHLSLVLSREFKDWHLQRGNVFSKTGNSATVGRILMIFSADPHEISIPIKW